jgi:hypothetical protein
MKYGSVCEIVGCENTSRIPSVSILKYKAIVPHLKENTTRKAGTLVYLCPEHKGEFGVVEGEIEETEEETVEETEEETENE